MSKFSSFIIILLFMPMQMKADQQSMSDYSHEVVEIDLMWDMYWDTLLAPEAIKHTILVSQKIPSSSSWTELGYPANGKATYHLLVDYPDSVSELSILVPKIWSNSKVWINGKMVSYRGKLPLTNSKHNVILEKLVTGIQQSDTLEIVVQVANRDIYIAGLVYPFKIGSADALRSHKTKTEALQTIWIGSLIIVGLFHLFIFTFSRHDKTYLFLSVISFLLVLKMIVFGENIVYQWLKETSILNFKWQNSLYYTATYSVASVGCLYVHSLYSEVGKKIPCYIVVILISVYCLFILVSPLSLYSGTLLPFQIVVGLAVLYMGYIVILGIKRDKSLTSKSIQIFGIFVMVLAAMNDGLYEYGFKTGLPQELLPYSFSIVVLLQMFLLAYERHRDHRQILDLVDHLEDRVKERTRIIDEQKNELKRISELKDKYLTNISHDLRSPLSVVLGYFFLIKERAKSLPGELKEFIVNAQEGIKKLETLVDHITTLTQIKSDGLQLKISNEDVAKLIKDQINSFDHLIKKKSVKLELDTCEDEIIAAIDPSHFFRVIQNLLANALQHTPDKGEIQIKICKEGDHIRIQFLNSGKIMDPELREKVFDRFYSSRQKEGGMGVGLELTRELVELHKGTITAREMDGMNCFEISLPHSKE